MGFRHIQGTSFYFPLSLPEPCLTLKLPSRRAQAHQTRYDLGPGTLNGACLNLNPQSADLGDVEQADDAQQAHERQQADQVAVVDVLIRAEHSNLAVGSWAQAAYLA